MTATTPGFDRRTLLRGSALLGGAAVMSGPLHALGMRAAAGAPPSASAGYGPLVDKGDLMLPKAFEYVVLDRQGSTMRGGMPTPGIFDGMGAFPGPSDTTILIRNHENRERPGETKVVTGPGFEYDETSFGGCVKVIVGRGADGKPVKRESFPVLGGTSTNCAGGQTPWKTWITCEEVVKRTNGIKHGYSFEIDAYADGPVAAVAIPRAGRFSHEAVAWLGKTLYQAEDRSKSADAVRGQIGAAFYRYVPDGQVGRAGDLAETTGVLQALKLSSEPNADMDIARVVGQPYAVEWVTIDEPDHEDDSDNRRDRVAGFTPTRVQAADKGAAVFSRTEGAWVGRGKVYFDCTSGGEARLGQIWEYDPGREVLTLIFESDDAAQLQSPDNIVIVPQTGDVFAQEDGAGAQFVRGITQDGEIYDFAMTVTSDSEFCGGCFDPSGRVFFLNQQGDRDTSSGPAVKQGVTYAIWGPFQARAGANNR